MGPKKLLHREWACILFALGFFAVLHFTAKANQIPEGRADRPIEKEKLIITLAGAIEEDKEVPCLPGTTLREVCRREGLKPKSLRKQLPLKKILLTDQTIVIPEKELP